MVVHKFRIYVRPAFFVFLFSLLLSPPLAIGSITPDFSSYDFGVHRYRTFIHDEKFLLVAGPRLFIPEPFQELPDSFYPVDSFSFPPDHYDLGLKATPKIEYTHTESPYPSYLEPLIFLLYLTGRFPR